MNIQVINFETCRDHYLITRMLKTTSNNQIEYVPSHFYKERSADCYILICKGEENTLLDWCQSNHVPLEKVIVLSNHPLNQFFTWVGINTFEKDIDFEKMCQWIMTIKEKNPEIDLFENRLLKTGKIRKDHDYELCLQSILKQNPDLGRNSEIFLFVKEKSLFLLNPPKNNKAPLKQYYIKGISETYDYLIVKDY